MVKELSSHATLLVNVLDVLQCQGGVNNFLRYLKVKCHCRVFTELDFVQYFRKISPEVSHLLMTEISKMILIPAVYFVTLKLTNLPCRRKDCGYAYV